MFTPNKGLVATYLACALITVGGIAFMKATNISVPIHTYTSYKSPSEILVTGEGKVSTAPDTAIITLGITTSRAQSAEAAQISIDDVHNSLVNAIIALGISKSDITTSTYSIQPNYTYAGSSQRIDGYNGTAQVTVKTKKVSAVDSILGQATALGVNQISDVSYTTTDPSAARDKARLVAIKNAKNTAQKLADELGFKLGKVINVSENTFNQPYPVAMGKSMEIAADSAEPNIQPGSDETVVSVAVIFEKR